MHHDARHRTYYRDVSPAMIRHLNLVLHEPAGVRWKDPCDRVTNATAVTVAAVFRYLLPCVAYFASFAFSTCYYALTFTSWKDSCGEWVTALCPYGELGCPDEEGDYDVVLPEPLHGTSGGYKVQVTVVGEEGSSSSGCSDEFFLMASEEAPETGDVDGPYLIVTSPTDDDFAVAGQEYTVEFEYDNGVGSRVDRFKIDLYRAGGSGDCGTWEGNICDKPSIGCKDASELMLMLLMAIAPFPGWRFARSRSMVSSSTISPGEKMDDDDDDTRHLSSFPEPENLRKHASSKTFRAGKARFWRGSRDRACSLGLFIPVSIIFFGCWHPGWTWSARYCTPYPPGRLRGDKRVIESGAWLTSLAGTMPIGHKTNKNHPSPFRTSLVNCRGKPDLKGIREFFQADGVRSQSSRGIVNRTVRSAGVLSVSGNIRRYSTLFSMSNPDPAATSGSVAYPLGETAGMNVFCGSYCDVASRYNTVLYRSPRCPWVGA